jgi:hypothetical protein
MKRRIDRYLFAAVVAELLTVVTTKAPGLERRPGAPLACDPDQEAMYHSQ